MLKVFVTLLATMVLLPGQFKYSAGVGLGICFPDFSGFNSTIEDSGLKKISSSWLPIGYDFSVKVYPSLRVGYFRYSSALFANKSSQDFTMVVSMNGISVQTFFAFLKRFEADFGIAPLLAKIDFSQKERKAETSPFRFSATTKAGIQNKFFAYYTWVGLRFHLTTYLALEGAFGYLKDMLNKKKWKNEGKQVGLNMDINMSRPLFRLAVVFGW